LSTPFGFETSGIEGGEGLGAFALPALLGGVLKGEMRSSSDLVAGSRLALGRAGVSTGCGLLGILGLPARFTGGGIGGAEEVGRSPLRGSPGCPEPVWVADKGFTSKPGVPFRLAILKGLEPLGATGGEGESRAACDFGREGRGERIGGVSCGGGERGDWTITLGGERVRERVGDLGGEKATIDVGRGLGLDQGARKLDERGVGLPFPLRSTTLGEDLSMCSLGMSSDMRPSVLRWSSGTRPSAGPGERWRGVAGAAVDLLALSRFSNWARREETGLMDEPSVLSGVVCWSMMGSAWSASARRGATAAHRPVWTCSHWALGGVAGGVEVGRAAVMQRSEAWGWCGCG
jgi:hypothetical protein